MKKIHLAIAAAVIVIAVLAAIVLPEGGEMQYAMSVEEITGEMMLSDHEMLPEHAIQITENEDPGYVFVDIRHPGEHSRGSIQGSVNIPFSDLLEHEVIRKLKTYADNSVTLVLYGNDQREAVGAYLFLRQTGFNNLKILPGGYRTFVTMTPGSQEGNFLVEEPVVDFRELTNRGEGPADAGIRIVPEPLVPVRREKKSALQGGC